MFEYDPPLWCSIPTGSKFLSYIVPCSVALKECPLQLLSYLVSTRLCVHTLLSTFHFSRQAIWENQFYYLFGFLFLVFVILIIACSEVSIVMTYFQLCGENYHWWWRSFLLSGSASYYVLAYSVMYYFTKVGV